MAINNNADEYAATRVGIFFPAHNSTPADGNLTGQCVTLLKWFFAEMCSVPNPFSARGHARFVGDTLVSQGHAYIVPFNERKRGDVICYKYGEYGHIVLMLSGDRVFEQNANVGGVARRVVDGSYVYASRIGSVNESWRPTPTVYRIKSYVENVQKASEDMPIPNADNYYGRYRKAMRYIRGRDMTREEFNKNFVGNSDLRMLEAMLDSAEADAHVDYANWGRIAKNEDWQGKLTKLQAQVAELGKRPTQEQIDAVNKLADELRAQAETAAKNAAAAQAKADELTKQSQIDYEAGKSIFRRIGIMLGLIKE